MTSKEYVIWLRGFVEACNEYAPTPKQWDTLKDKLAEVGEPISLPIGTPIGEEGMGFPNTTPNTHRGYTHPFPTWQEPHYKYPADINKVTCENENSYKAGTADIGVIYDDGKGIGMTGITGNINSGKFTYNPSTTTTAYPSGSAWSYTNTLPKEPTKESNQLELNFESENK